MPAATRDTASKRRGESAYSQKLKSRHVACQVNGCEHPLPSKAYHHRYRICPYHASLKQAVIDGTHVRFCQHCGRFQSLHEFDDGLKSCRRSLDLHRKSQNRRNKVKTQRSPTGTRTSTASDDTARGSKEDTPSGATAGAGGQFIGLPSDQSLKQSAGSSCAPQQPTHSWGAGDEVHRPSPPLNSGPPQIEAAPAAYAPLPWVDQSAWHDHNSAMHRGSFEVHPGHPLVGTVAPYTSHHSGPYTGVQGHHDAAAGAAGAGGDHFHGVPGIPAHQDWVHAEMAMAELAELEATLGPALLPLPPAVPAPRPNLVPLAQVGMPGAMLPSVDFEGTLDAALNFLSTGPFSEPSAAFQPGESPINRVSLKLFNSSPAELPSSVHNMLQEIMKDAQAVLSATNVRPGCAHITIDAILTRAQAKRLQEMGPDGVLQAIKQRGDEFFPAHTFDGPKGRVVAQLGNATAVADGAGVTPPIILDPLAGLLPELVAVVPLAVAPTSKDPFILLGRSIAGSHDLVVCRRGAFTPNLEIMQSGTAEALAFNNEASSSTAEPTAPLPGSFLAEGLAAGEYVSVGVPRLEEGLHCMEVQRGSLLSKVVPFLVMSDADAVAELRQLERDATGVPDVATFVHSVGIVLESLLHSESYAPRPTTRRAAALAVPVPELAARLAVTCAARGWPAMLRLLLPAMTPEAAVHFAGGPGRASLLHVVASSRCVALVHVLREWAEGSNHVWECRATGPSRMTPLHLAALIDDGAAMASALTTLFPTGASLWHSLHGADGLTPASLAKVSENAAVLDWLHTQPGGARPATEEEEGAMVAASASALAMRASGSKAGQGSMSSRAIVGDKGADLLVDDIVGDDEWPYSSLGGDNVSLNGASAVLRWSDTAAHAGVSVAALLFAIGLRIFAG